MKNAFKSLLLILGLFAAPAFAQVVTLPVVNTATGLKTNSTGAVIIGSDGVEKGTVGNPLVTSGGSSSSQLPATLGPKTGALSLSVVPNTDTPFPASQSGTWTSAVTQATASSLNAQIVGSQARAASVSANPVLGGGRGGSVAPSAVANGQVVDAWLDQNGATVVSTNSVGLAATDSTSNSLQRVRDAAGNPLAYLTYGLAFNGSGWDRQRTIVGAVADGTGLGVTAVEQAGALFNNITAATTTTVKSGKGILHKIVLNTYVASATITIYDNTAGSGTKIGTLTLPSTITSDTPITLPYDLQFSTGLTFVTSGATDITVIYR